MRSSQRRRAHAAVALSLVVGLVAATHLIGAGVAPAQAASREVNQWYKVPASGAFNVRGHGYGHGRGMSQHGAQGAARAGLTHEEILAFYYPGTELERASRRIRVLISSDTTSDVEVLHQDGLGLRDLGAKRRYALPTDLGATRWRLTTDNRNRAVVDYYAEGRWERWSPGGSEALEGDGQFGGGGPVTLVTPAGQRTYRGTLRAASPGPDATTRQTVNVLTLDNYVKGVVAAEMPALWEPEAVQAQTVAARSYAVWHRSNSAGRSYHICDTTACQVYRGRDAEHPASNAAVRATRREVLTWGGEPAFTEFSASSGGWTVASSIPYQVAQPDPYDGWIGNANHDWSVRLRAAAIQKAYPALGKLRGVRVVARDGHGQWKGRVDTLVLDGKRKNLRITGGEFRSRFGLRSTWFRL